MRAAIITFHFAYNYGAALQAYALQQFIKRIGWEAEILNYFPGELRHLYTLNPFIICRKKEFFEKIRKFFRCRKQFRIFQQFIREELQCTEPLDIEDLKEAGKQYDVCITGSDQVWNDSIAENLSPYFLEFADSSRRKIAYAASFGKEVLSGRQKAESMKNLTGFDWVSVREGSGMKSLSALGIASEQAADPVFLLGREEWRKKEKEIPHPRKYVLCYALSDNQRIAQEAGRAAAAAGCKIMIIHPSGEKKIKIRGALYPFDVGPFEFLYLADHAEVIVTDSFHATAFGVIFGKEVRNLSDPERMVRAKDLLESLGAGACVQDDRIIMESGAVSEERLTEFCEHSKEKLRTAGLGGGLA